MASGFVFFSSLKARGPPLFFWLLRESLPCRADEPLFVQQAESPTGCQLLWLALFCRHGGRATAPTGRPDMASGFGFFSSLDARGLPLLFLSCGERLFFGCFAVREDGFDGTGFIQGQGEDVGQVVFGHVREQLTGQARK